MGQTLINTLRFSDRLIVPVPICLLVALGLVEPVSKLLGL